MQVVRPTRFTKPAFMGFQRVTGTLPDSTNTLTLTFSDLGDASNCVPLIQCYGNDESGLYAYYDKTSHAANVWDDNGTVKCTVTRNTITTQLPDLYFAVTLL